MTRFNKIQGDNSNTCDSMALFKINPITRASCPPDAGEGIGREWLNNIKSVFADVFGDLNQECNSIVPVIAFIGLALIIYVGI